MIVADDAGDAADELGVHKPQEPPLERFPEPPQPGQQVIHAGGHRPFAAPHSSATVTGRIRGLHSVQTACTP